MQECWKGDKMRKPISEATAALLIFSALLSSHDAYAGQLDRRLIGAWAQSASDCKRVFEVRNGRVAFRQPVNEFIPAFIIDPQHIVAANGECRVGKVAVKGDEITASLDCNNKIGFAPVSARFKVLDENEILYGSTDNPLLDSNYERCR